MRYNIPEQEGNNHVGTDYIAFSPGLVRADGGVGYCLGLRVPGLWAGGGIFSLLLGVAVLVLLVALISRAFRDSGRGHGHPYRDNARDDDFISFYDKDAVK